MAAIDNLADAVEEIRAEGAKLREVKKELESASSQLEDVKNELDYLAQQLKTLRDAIQEADGEMDLEDVTSELTEIATALEKQHKELGTVTENVEAQWSVTDDVADEVAGYEEVEV